MDVRTAFTEQLRQLQHELSDYSKISLLISACRELLTFLRNMRAGNLEKFPQITRAAGTIFQYCRVYGERQFKEESHATALHERRGRRNSTD